MDTAVSPDSTFRATAKDGTISVQDGPCPRPEVRGKFLFVDDQKLYVKGVTYGTFRPSEEHGDYPPPERVADDFARMAASGVNAVRTYTVPPRWLLDLARDRGLYVMVGLPWEQHVAFLDGRERRRSIERGVREGVRACAGHPALLCFVVGNEIPAPIVRWHGARHVQRFLERLYRAAKEEDPGALVTYVNFPSTEYLDLSFVDFVCFNVYLEQRERLEGYLRRLQSLTGPKPLVMAEIGLDSRRNGLERQAEALEWQVEAAFETGCAGAFVFAWTDEWHRGGYDIDDWDFGLTTRDRRPKPALGAVSRAFACAPFAGGHAWPRVSVIVCTYNGARTLAETLAHLRALDYPDYEIVVVDDGSTDDSAAIAADFGVNVVSTPNRGLSAARNVGCEVADGEIVAYIDDDAWPDPHWLRYMVATLLSGGHAGVGGPNLAPPDDGPVADCVANSPGGPIQVMLSDSEAEHIPGCNMAWHRGLYRAVGGFDPQFHVAGDDVDFCWRVQERGWTIGFSPAAVVWHHRRDSVRAYLRQQRSYGVAEALLERKWPARYNAIGSIRWFGRLYGGGLVERLARSRGRIYFGTWGSGLFQAVYQPQPGMVSAAPQVPEWYLLVATLAALSLGGIVWTPLLLALPLLAAALAPPIAQAALSAVRAPLRAPPGRTRVPLRLRALTAMLYLLQPATRLCGRLARGLTPWRRSGGARLVLPRARQLAQWHEIWQASDERLRALERALIEAGAVPRHGGDFDRWDLHVRGGGLAAARARMAIEEHGAGRQLVRLRVWPRLQPAGRLVVTLVAAAALAAAALGQWEHAATLLAIGVAALARSAYEVGSALTAFERAATSTAETPAAPDPVERPVHGAPQVGARSLEERSVATLMSADRRGGRR